MERGRGDKSFCGRSCGIWVGLKQESLEYYHCNLIRIDITICDIGLFVRY